MTEYQDSAFESVVRCGIAPKGWKLLRSSDKSWRFKITVYHTKTLGMHVTSLKIGITKFRTTGILYISSSSYCKISSLLMFMQVRYFCFLEDSFSTQTSTRKASLSNHLVIPVMV